jgi:predicted small metal-binding protein
MSAAYKKEYEIVEANKKRELPSDMKNINLAVFYNGLRRATNKVKAESPKIIEIMKIIKDHLAKNHTLTKLTLLIKLNYQNLRKKIKSKKLK